MKNERISSTLIRLNVEPIIMFASCNVMIGERITCCRYLLTCKNFQNLCERLQLSALARLKSCAPDAGSFTFYVLVPDEDLRKGWQVVADFIESRAKATP